jgi:hypothetical protein
MNKVVISKNNIFYDTYLPFSGEVIEDVPSIESIFFLLRYVLLLHKIHTFVKLLSLWQLEIYQNQEKKVLYSHPYNKR